MNRIYQIFLMTLLVFTGHYYSYGMRPDSSYKVIIESGAGYGLSTDTLSQASTRYGISALFRVLWKPDHLLKMGVETGWLHISRNTQETITNEFGTSNVEATLKAIPIMLVFDMDVWGLNLYTGLGYYYVISSIKAFDESVTNANWNVGFYLSLSYKYPLTDNIKFGSELKWNSIGELGKTLLSGQFFISYDLFEW